MIKKYLCWGKNLISMLFSKLYILLGFKYNKKLIPKGLYCYEPDWGKSKFSLPYSYYISPCPYYKTLGKRWNGCKYLGTITDDFVFGDMCKICGEKQ